MATKRHINVDISELTDEERQEWIEEEEHRRYQERNSENVPDIWEVEDENFDWDWDEE